MQRTLHIQPPPLIKTVVVRPMDGMRLLDYVFLFHISVVSSSVLDIPPLVPNVGCGSAFCNGRAESLYSEKMVHFGQRSNVDLRPLFPLKQNKMACLKVLLIGVEHYSLAYALVEQHVPTLKRVQLVAYSKRVTVDFCHLISRLSETCELRLIACGPHHKKKSENCEEERNALRQKFSCFRGQLVMQCGVCEHKNILSSWKQQREL